MISPKNKERLDRLQLQLEADSLAETVRRSLALTQHLLDATADGAQLVIEQPDGGRQEIALV